MKFFSPGLRVCLVLLVLLSACSAPAANTPIPCPPISIGVIVADSGVSGAQDQRDGYELALNEINKAGGISNCPVKLIYQPEGNPSNPDEAQVAMLNLTDQGVVAVLGSTSNNAGKRMAAISSYFKVPVIITGETGDDILEVGSTWVFRILPTNKSQAGVAFDMVSATIGKQINLAIIYEHTEYGESAAVAAGKAALDRGMRLVSYRGYFPAAIDFASIMAQLKTSAVDVIYLINSDPKQASELIKAFQNQYLGVTMMIGSGNGFTSSDFLYAKGSSLIAPQNLFVAASWSADLPYRGSAKFAYDLDTYRQSNGVKSAIPPVVNTVQAYTALHVVTEGVKTLLSNQKDNWRSRLSMAENLPAFRESLSSTLRAYRSNTQDTLLGALEFDSAGQSKKNAILLQVRDTKLVTVFPPELAVQSPSYTKGW